MAEVIEPDAGVEPGEGAPPRGRYKVVELSTVTDEAIEAALNEWTSAGWTFDGLHFAMRESSKRPSMAFLVFTRA
ncbi:DUF4177 domain-containing protein [Myxococcota bacterium]|nr:DUF4177 domain-containing protein [Myxococcota bacterium]